MTAFIEIEDATDLGRCQYGRFDPEDLAGSPPSPREGFSYYPLTEAIDWRNRPSVSHVVKWNAGAWEWADSATLADLKALKNEEINRSRLAANRSSFKFAGKDIACDELSMLDIQTTNGGVCLRGTLRPGWLGGWKAMDNTYVAIPDVATWHAFYAAIEDTGQANFNHAQALKAQLAVAASAAEVEAIQWSTTEGPI